MGKFLNRIMLIFKVKFGKTTKSPLDNYIEDNTGKRISKNLTKSQKQIADDILAHLAIRVMKDDDKRGRR